MCIHYRNGGRRWCEFAKVVNFSWFTFFLESTHCCRRAPSEAECGDSEHVLVGAPQTRTPGTCTSRNCPNPGLTHRAIPHRSGELPWRIASAIWRLGWLYRSFLKGYNNYLRPPLPVFALKVARTGKKGWGRFLILKPSWNLLRFEFMWTGTIEGEHQRHDPRTVTPPSPTLPHSPLSLSWAGLL